MAEKSAVFRISSGHRSARELLPQQQHINMSVAGQTAATAPRPGRPRLAPQSRLAWIVHYYQNKDLIIYLDL